LERDDDNKIMGIDKDGSSNQVDEEEEPPPPPVAARPERTKSIVIWVLSFQIFHKDHFGKKFRRIFWAFHLQIP